jgi:PBSX family phage terminase large subunit
MLDERQVTQAEFESWHGQEDFQGLTDWSAYQEGTVISVPGKMPLLPRFVTEPQHRLISTKSKFPAFVAGFGSGKSSGLVRRMITKKLENRTCNVGYYFPTFDLVRKIGFPYFQEELDTLKIRHRLNKSLAEIEVFESGKIIFRTMENPHRIIGYEVADSALDELDVLKTEDAREVWNKVVARNRQKKPNGAFNTIAVGTTPEGFKFVYEIWEKKLLERLRNGGDAQGFELIRASTYSNQRNLPKDYIENMFNQYEPALIEAYIMGQFVNLQGGTVYRAFDRKLNHTDETLMPGEALHIGMDFNVANMAAIVHVIRAGEPRAIAEITKVFDTPAIIKTIEARWPNHNVKFIYPDASGKGRKTVDASKSDLALLQRADPEIKKPAYNIIVDTTNPLVKDRVLAMNGAFCNSFGYRKYKVNTKLCPTYTEHLEQQIYNDKGEPDKDGGHDHTNDAGGYFICKRWPVLKPNAQRARITGT